MTFLDMATFVCAKVRSTDSASVALCKQFLQRRLEAIYADALWKDSLYVLRASYDPVALALTSQNAGVLFLPDNVETVVAVRSDNGPMTPMDRMESFRYTQEVFDESGDPVGFNEEAPALAEFSSAQAVTVVATGDNIVNNGVLVQYQDGNGKRIRESIAAKPGTPVSLASTARVIESMVTAGKLGEGTQYSFGYGLAQNVTFNSIVPAGQRLTAGAYNIAPLLAADGTYYYFTPGTGESLSVDAGDYLTATSFVLGTFAEIDGIGTNFIRSTITASLPDGTALIVPQKRLRLARIPIQAINFQILHKRKLVNLSADTDEPVLHGVDNALMTFAHADMLQWMRQYGKAQAIQSEAVGLLAQLKNVETVQRASRPKIIPHVEPDWINSGIGGNCGGVKGYW